MREVEYLGCRIRRTHGPTGMGMVWKARTPAGVVVAMEKTLTETKAELDRLAAKGVRW